MSCVRARRTARPGSIGFSSLEVCGRGRVDDHPDGVAAALLAKLEQLGNAPGRRFCLIPSPQLTVELEHGSEIVVEREPAS